MKNQKMLFVIFGLVLILAMVKIFFANLLSAGGEKINMLEKEALALEFENSLLEEKIIRLSSLSLISTEAKKMGFIKPGKVLNLTSEIPVALK